MEHRKIRWAPKVRPEKIMELYRQEGAGLADEYIVNDVAIALYARCCSIVMVNRGQVECPQCGEIFHVLEEGIPIPHGGIQCPNGGCPWKITLEAYRQSWRHRDLNGTNALPSFLEFLEKYPRAKSQEEKMVLVDQLLHSFHWDMKLNLPNRSAANNLIEGSHDQVVRLLDGISYGDESSKKEWRKHVDDMWKRRRGKG